MPTPPDLDAEQLWRTLDALITGSWSSAGIATRPSLAGVRLRLRRPDGVAGRASSRR